MIRTAAHFLSPAGTRGRLSILIFHRVLSQVDPLRPDEPDQQRFEQVLRWVARWFCVLPLDEAAEHMARRSLPARALAITFDDGYEDNFTVALPVLQRLGLPATFFVATSFLDGGRMWNDSVIEAVRACRAPHLDLGAVGLGVFDLGDNDTRRRTIDRLLPIIKYLEPEQRQAAVAAVQEACREPLPTNLMMSSSQVVALRRAGMQIGAHTRTHPILTKLTEGAANSEIEGSKRDLEALLGEAVCLFAYPNGRPHIDYNAEHAKMVRRAGFAAAVSTAAGAGTVDSDPFQLPRILPWDRQSSRFGLRMLANLRVAGAVA